MRRFSDLNPIVILTYYLCVLFVTMFSMNPVILLISMLSSVTVYSLYSAKTARSHFFSIGLFIILALINPIIVHNGATVLFYLNGSAFTMEALIYGVTAAVMVTASLYHLRSLSRDITADKLQYIFGRFSPKLALILSMALRMTALFKARWRSIQDSQKALGLYTDGNLIDAVRGRARVLSILITWSLENGIITAESMDARGYGSRRRTSFAVYRMRPGDALILAVVLALTGLGIAGLCTARIRYYPTISAQLFDPLSIAGYCAFGLLCILPLMINIKEAIKWRCSISKI